MKKLASLFLSIVLTSQMAAAACEDNVTYLLKGQQAPCAGYLLTPEMELRVRQDLIRLDGLQQKVVKYEELILLYDKQSRQYEEQIGILQKQTELTTWEKVLYFALGALAVGATVYVTR